MLLFGAGISDRNNLILSRDLGSSNEAVVAYIYSIGIIRLRRVCYLSFCYNYYEYKTISYMELEKAKSLITTTISGLLC
jgi:hypothetical protein